jgi:glycosyltransferase involved in cell wall biosynthesis
MPRKSGNIVVVGNPPFRPAGGGILSGHLARLLSSSGHTVRTIYPIYRDTQVWRDRFRQQYPSIEAYWYEMPALYDAFAGFSRNDLALQARNIEAGLRHFLTDARPDLIYLHKESSIWALIPFLRQQRLPVLSTLHGNLLAMLNGATENGPTEEWLDAHREADLLTCCAAHMTARLREAGVTNTVTVQNCVDIEKFHPRERPAPLAAELGVTADDMVVLHASDLKSIKRPLDILRGFASAHRRDRRLRLLVVGASYMQSSRDAITAEAKRLGISERVQVKDWVDPSAMPHYYALADIVVQASASEGLSLTCLESMASGRLLIASDIPASRELIRDGIDGMLFPLGDVEALGRAINVAAADNALRARLGAAARARVAADFSLERMERRLLSVIDDML